MGSFVDEYEMKLKLTDHFYKYFYSHVRDKCSSKKDCNSAFNTIDRVIKICANVNWVFKSVFLNGRNKKCLRRGFQQNCRIMQGRSWVGLSQWT